MSWFSKSKKREDEMIGIIYKHESGYITEIGIIVGESSAGFFRSINLTIQKKTDGGYNFISSDAFGLIDKQVLKAGAGYEILKVEELGEVTK